MPTVHRQDGFRIAIFVVDHEPAHVHVVKGESRVKVNLLDVSVIEQHETSIRDIHRILEIVEAQRTALLEAWVKIHGSK